MAITAEHNKNEQPHILVVDDDDRIRTLLFRYLSEHGFTVVTARDAAQARAACERLTFDGLVVDIMMPGETGLDFVKKLRQDSTIPVLFLTALGEADDRIAGLESGADDYLPKPFEPRELVLRLEAILRRVPSVKEEREMTFSVGGYRYDARRNLLQKDDAQIALTEVEGNLLRALARYAGEVVSRDKLAELCDLKGGGRAIDVQVMRLRRKMEQEPDMKRALQTVRGQGYLLWAEEA